MPGPGSTITITLEAFTEAANSKLRGFFHRFDADIARLNAQGAKPIDELGNAAERSGHKIAGMTFYFRSMIDSVRFAAAQGGPRAAFYAIDEAVRGLLVSGSALGISFSTIATGAVLLAPIIADLALAWSTYRQNVAEGASADRVEVQTLQMQTLGFKALQEALDRNIISLADWQKIHGELMNGSVNTAFGHLQELGIGPKQIAAYDKMQALDRQMTDNALEDFDKQRAKAHEVYEARLAEIANLAAKSKIVADEQRKYESDAAAEVNAKLRAIDQAEQTKKAQEAIQLHQQMQTSLINAAQAGADKRSAYSEEEFLKDIGFLHELQRQYPEAQDEITKANLAAVEKRNAAIRSEVAEEKRLEEELQRLARLKEGILQQDAKVPSRNPILGALGGGAENSQSDLNRLNEQIASTQAALQRNTEQSFQPQSAQQQIELLSQRKQLEEELNRLLVEQGRVQERVDQERVQGVRTMFANMGAAAKAFGKEGVAVYKGMAIAQATIDTAKAAIGAYSSVVGIPYVGPILAPIAAAAAVAAGAVQIAAIESAAYREGGFTGDGGPDEVAGIVHRGEFVIPAQRVDQLGLGFLHRLNSGQFSAAGAPSLSSSEMQSGPGGGVTHHETNLHLAVVDSEEAAKRVLESEHGEKFWLSMADKHISKFQR